MGFWDVTKRIVQGKPAFEAPQPGDDWDDDAPTADFSEERAVKRTAAADASLIDAKGYKHPPVASITNVKDELSGQYYELWATIKNQSEREILLDKITLLGSKFRMNYPLKAGAQRVFQVYRGARLTHDNYKKAELYYKDVPTGDYFRADHLLQYKYDADGTYEVVDFELFLPIYDV